MVLNIRNIAAFFVSGYFIATGRIRKVKKQAADGRLIISVYFHDPEKKLFESCVKWFLKNGFHFLSAEELYHILSGQKPFPPSAVIFTADDGWKNNKENIAAVAEKYKIPVTIFASTQPVETGEAYWWSYITQAKEKGIIQETVSALKKVSNEERLRVVDKARQQLPLEREALTVEELKYIAKSGYVNFESHTVTHPILTKCSDENAFFEITEAKKKIEQWLKKDIKHFAYPNGMFSEREIRILKESGFQTAFSTIPEYITDENRNRLYAIPRFDVLETVSFTENICRMTGVWFNRKGI